MKPSTSEPAVPAIAQPGKIYSLNDWLGNYKLPDFYEVLIKSIEPDMQLNCSFYEDCNDLVAVLIYGLFLESGFDSIESTETFDIGYDINRLNEVIGMPRYWKQYNKYCFKFTLKTSKELIEVTLLKDNYLLLGTCGPFNCVLPIRNYVKWPRHAIISKRFQYLHNLAIKVRDNFILPIRKEYSDASECTRQCNNILEFPEEIHRLIVGHLCAKSFVRLASTCTKLYQYRFDEAIWRKLYQKKSNSLAKKQCVWQDLYKHNYMDD